jgi:uncharacterized protein YbjT (DUF2867 family)
MNPSKFAAPNGPILVTGGTGTLGRLVVARLLNNGQAVRVLSRGRLVGDVGSAERVTADLATGDGVDAALKDTQIVLHLAGSARGDEAKARNLVLAATRAGVRHIVYISVVGADRIPVRSWLDRALFGYFAAKRAAEEVIADSGLPWTTLRSTQTHQLNFKVVQGMSRLPIVPVPSGWRFQPIDAGEVADRLVELALGAPGGLVPAVGGPRIYEMTELVRSYLHVTGRRRPIVSMPLAGGAARAFRQGANLAPDRAVGQRTWEDFLADQVGRMERSIGPAGEVKSS